MQWLRTAFLGASLSVMKSEWVLESTFRRGQPNPVGGMETISKERDLLVCCICRRKHGVCIKCNHDDCQIAFHPICAKRVGLHMDVKTGGGKFFQHKAYCEKHSLDQKKKAESLQHGPDEVRHIKQIRPAGQSYLLRLQCLLRTIRMENAGGGNDDVGLEAAEDVRAVLSQGPPSFKLHECWALLFPRLKRLVNFIVKFKVLVHR